MLVGSSSETPRRSAGAGGWCGGGCWLTPVAEWGCSAWPVSGLCPPAQAGTTATISTAQCPPGLQPANTPRKIFLSSKNILFDSHKSSLQPPGFIPWLHLSYGNELLQSSLGLSMKEKTMKSQQIPWLPLTTLLCPVLLKTEKIFKWSDSGTRRAALTLLKVILLSQNVKLWL